MLTFCKSYNRNKSHADFSTESIKKGEKLAAIYCQSCHQLPDPLLLPSHSWENGVLPVMGPRLGIFGYGYKMYPSGINDRNLDKGFYPSSPVLSLEDWQHIMDYYVATSPDSLESLNDTPIKNDLSLFKVESTNYYLPNPMTSFVHVDTSSSAHQIIFCDVRGELYRANNKLQVFDSTNIGGSIVGMEPDSNKLVACDIGQLNPTNGKFGKAKLLGYDSGKIKGDTTPIISELKRPVQVLPVDLNKDGKTDFLVCEFGYLTGSLSWYENKGAQGWQRHVLRALPGAIKVYIRDENHDGLPDIWVLFAQGEEGVFLYTNKGNGQFDEQELLRFPPSYGSTSFQLVDMNKDGFEDIIYTCGDNGDYSPVLKPYHGVYVFLNDGQNHFKQDFFFHINGCYKAIAADFDGDGDMDIAAISFFADYAHRPEEGFVYLDNNNFTFTPHSISATQQGRWLTMDAGDFDGDGKIDLVLGNFTMGPVITKPTADWSHSPPFLYLHNISTHKK